MPINYLEIKQQIKDFCSTTRLQMEKLDDLLLRAEARLNDPGMTKQEIIAKIQTAAKTNPNIRCAVPLSFPLSEMILAPELIVDFPIIAADGSQVVPSRHRQVEFGAINIAAISMIPGSGVAPNITLRSTLLNFPDMTDAIFGLSEGKIALIRDLHERKLLAELAEKLPSPVISITDGGLELFREPGADREYEEMFREYMTVLAKFQTFGAIPAGYVDKPGSRLVSAMLDLLGANPSAGDGLSILSDRILFSRILSQPYSRSAVFGIQSSQSHKAAPELAVNFFYYNASRQGAPKIARVEIPAWVAEDEASVQRLHAALIQQCRINGWDFPYLLGRAHEEAVIRYEDSLRLEEMIAAGMRSENIPMGDMSEKQRMKDGSGRKG